MDRTANFHVMQATADGADVNEWDFPTWADAEYARCIASLDALTSGSTDTYYVTDGDYKLCEQDPGHVAQADAFATGSA